MLKKYAGIIVLLFIFIGCTASVEKEHFVKVKGNQFELAGKKYCYLGTNFWYGANLGAQIDGGNRERLVKELDFMKSIGITNLRVLGASEEGGQYNTVRPAIQEKPGQYNEDLLIGLDFLLSEMGKRNMHAVIFLNNYWVWSGGMSQYVSWFENEPVPNPFLEQYDWSQFMNFSARFYTNKEANQSYRDFIKSLINRKNTITNKFYKHDPAIMSWQLANEPRPGDREEGKRNYAIFSKWINETAGYIKSLDKNHLVSTGNEGTAGCIGSAKVFKEIHSYDNVDYMTFHLWILNWQWFDPLKAEETYPEAKKKAVAYVKEHIGYANEVGKPIVIEEFGIPRDMHKFSPETSTVYRDKYYDTLFNEIYKDAASGGPMVGSNFWGWGGFGNARDTEIADWKSGDDFTGDPPQEPQGRNSVFVGDSSTVEILKKYAEMMSGIH